MEKNTIFTMSDGQKKTNIFAGKIYEIEIQMGFQIFQRMKN